MHTVRSVTDLKPLLTVISVVTLVTGCTTRARLAQDFRNDRDRCVGELFMDRSSSNCGWLDVIEMRTLDERNDEYLIASDHMGRCRWSYIVDRATRRVIGWRYVSGEDNCYNRIDWLGPW